MVGELLSICSGIVSLREYQLPMDYPFWGMVGQFCVTVAQVSIVFAFCFAFLFVCFFALYR